MMDKGKKAKLDDEDASEQLDSELLLAIEKLEDVQDELEKVNEEASDKVLEVEQKYNEIRRPIYKKRHDIIQSIPDFWLKAFLSHPGLVSFLSEVDQKVFKHLISLDVEDFKDVKSGYSITFKFRPNPYFEDTRLVKVFRFTDEGNALISGTSIRWKDGMDVTNGLILEKDGNKRSFSETSFFKWFSDTQQIATDCVHDEIAEVIKDDLWPNPLKYFNSEDDSDEYQDEGEDGEFGEDDDDDNDAVKEEDNSDDEEEDDADEDDEENE